MAVEKYDEVLHNLAFARELHKTLDDLTQNVRASSDLTAIHFSFFLYPGRSLNDWAVIACPG